MKTLLKSGLISLTLASAMPAALAQEKPASAPVAAADPARVAAARPVVEKLFPVGTYRRMLGETMSKMMDGMMGNMMKMPIAQIASMSGVAADKLTGMSQASLEEVSTIVDPHFRERTKLGMDAMMAGMADIMNDFEPNVREALIRAYARKFDVRQLGEINAFFITPTGNKFASDYMSMFMDPDIMGEMQALMPQMMKKMPELAERARKAADSLPPPRKISDLSKAEKDKLAQLLGVKANELNNSHAGEGTE
ncbi:DUF2059 domain-containing protein [Sphingobium sp. BYY-5]|uniref:DUF2059 domain-containing protein n=1 Tax=Sphingobium sp. BYY-5 TaxID=2926400 RepID=UPI001FA6B938|nr:DUF2059 domain-containing protein [Sphingobium sp. BYY-5]MCI4590972.1 DUF2059 domain-containing protein [Sphingobium sp. BYY-5]